MNLEITARHMEVSQRVRDYAEERLGKLAQLMGDPFHAHLVLETEKHKHVAELQVNSQAGSFTGAEATDDLFAAIRVVARNVERQARRTRDKRRDHKHRQGPRDPKIAQVIADEAALDAVARSAPAGPQLETDISGTQVLVYGERKTVETRSVQGAGVNFLQSGASALIFRDESTDDLCVLSKRDDGHLLLTRLDD